MNLCCKDRLPSILWYCMQCKNTQGSQEQKVNFQDQIFSKYQDIFVGFTKLKTQKMHTFLCTQIGSCRSTHGTMNCHNPTQYWTLNDSNKHVVNNIENCSKQLPELNAAERLRLISGHSYQMTKISAQFLSSGQFQTTLKFHEFQKFQDNWDP